MTEARKGVLAILAAATIWGLSSIYYKVLADVPPLEVLSHRTIWSAVFLGAALLLQRRSGELRELLARPGACALLTVSSLMIGCNWLGFIWAIQNGRALEASLGYYVFPLFAVALGFLLLGERFTAPQSAAIALATLAVAVLTLGLGVPPWLALMLASTFSAYGLVKTRVPFGSVLTVLFETLLITPLGLVWLFGAHTGAWTDLGGRAGGFFGQDLATSLLLVCAGPLTGMPLILFSYAARRLPYATVGLIQYLNPTLQFFVAVVLFGEPFTRWHAVAFPLIWAALALYSWGAWQQERDARNRAIRAGTVS